jgi:hypothetical protein
MGIVANIRLSKQLSFLNFTLTGLLSFLPKVLIPDDHLRLLPRLYQVPMASGFPVFLASGGWLNLLDDKT